TFSEDSAMALPELRGDVHDKSGPDVSVGDGIQNLERTMRLAFEGQLLEAGQEAAFVAEDRGVVMGWMASFPVGKDDRAGTDFPDDCGEGQLVEAGRLQIVVGSADL